MLLILLLHKCPLLINNNLINILYNPHLLRLIVHQHMTLQNNYCLTYIHMEFQKSLIIVNKKLIFQQQLMPMKVGYKYYKLLFVLLHMYLLQLNNNLINMLYNLHFLRLIVHQHMTLQNNYCLTYIHMEFQKSLVIVNKKLIFQQQWMPMQVVYMYYNLLFLLLHISSMQ